MNHDIWTCPLCNWRMDVDQDNPHAWDSLLKHAIGCGLVREFGNAIHCSCGTRMIALWYFRQHLFEPHDWPAILTQRLMKEM